MTETNFGRYFDIDIYFGIVIPNDCDIHYLGLVIPLA